MVRSLVKNRRWQSSQIRLRTIVPSAFDRVYFTRTLRDPQKGHGMPVVLGAAIITS
jgi:hypothetical protein